MSKFENALLDDVKGIDTLPLLHTCDAFTLRSILEQLALVPQKCDVFSVDLLYAYYGIPSYRSNYKLATLNPAFHMICIILDGEKIDGLHKVYPFDSGAFEKLEDMKETFFHPKHEIGDFELENSIIGAKKVIKTFYDTNENYLSQTPKISKKFGQFEFEAISYENLITQKGNSKLDDRASSIEMLFNKQIPLNKTTVRQIIIPNVFKDDKDIIESIEINLGISNPIGYATNRGCPIESFGLIRNEYFKFLGN